MPRYLVIARDPLLVAEGVAARLPAGLAVERSYAADLSLEAIFTQLAIPDLFSAQRAVHYVDILGLKLNKHDGERLAQILLQLPPELHLACSQVLSAETRSEEERQLKGADFQRWASGAQLDDLRKLSEGQAALRWLEQRARERYQLKLSPVQLAQVFTLSGESLALADTELRKLNLLLGGDTPQAVPDELLRASLSSNPVAHFYDLVDAILSGAREAQARLVQWFSLEPEPHRLVGELRRRLLGLLALERGGPPPPPYLANQLKRLAPRLNGERLRRAVLGLAELEQGLKTSAYPGVSSRDGELAGLQLYVRSLQ